MQPRIITLFIVLRGRLREISWMTKRRYLRRIIRLKTVTDIRTGNIPESRLRSLVNLGRSCGYHIKPDHKFSSDPLEKSCYDILACLYR